MEKAREQGTECELQRAISLFKCIKDDDIQEFLHNKAIEFEDREQCRVYLILDEDKFDSGEISVQAYFTLSHRSLRYNDGVSKSKIKNISGYKDRELESFVLIGQLGKHIDVEYSSPILLGDIMKYVDEIIYKDSHFYSKKANCFNTINLFDKAIFHRDT